MPIDANHSGDLGDIIYCLCALRDLGEPVHLFLTTALYTRARMTPAAADNIAPLLRAQPYISGACFAERIKVRRPGVEIPEGRMPVDVNLDIFRKLLPRLDGWINLADAQRLSLGLRPCNPYEPWLAVPKPARTFAVLFHRSPRHHNPRFDWKAVAQEYGHCAGVLGSPDEYRALCEEMGRELPHVPTANLLELAQVVAGCELVVANQSCPYAVAEGLKKPTVLEVYPSVPNCCFARHTARYAWDQMIDLPKV
jgi:hypothetical protein